MKLMSEETKQFFLSMLKESDGCPVSMTRFLSLFTIVLSNIAMWGTWLLICYFEGHIADIPDGVIYVYVAANGLTLTGKVAQKFVEKKGDGIQ